jgi:hypothetical protein
MAFGPVRLALASAVFVLACGAGAPSPSITAIMPARGYSDRPVRVTIQGKGFLPTFDIDPTSGRRRGDVSGFWGQVGTDTLPVLLRDFDWLDMNTISALMDPGLPAGTHRLTVIDPRGESATLPNAFWSLGPDDDAPTVTIERPTAATPIVGGTVLDCVMAAADREPGVLQSVRWQAWAGGMMVDDQDCRFDIDHTRARCDFQVKVPAWMTAGDQFSLRAIAIDSGATGNRTEASVLLTVQNPPRVLEVSPARGGIVGGTDLVVRGAGFHPGTQVYVGDLLMLPGGGTIVDAQTIVGRAPAHAAGWATVLARTPIGDAMLPGAFEYRPPPQIETILPESGDPDGGTEFRVRGHGFSASTQIFFGDSLVSAEPCEDRVIVSDVEITGHAPAGQGNTSVWAFDAELGWTRLPDGFAWKAP